MPDIVLAGKRFSAPPQSPKGPWIFYSVSSPFYSVSFPLPYPSRFPFPVICRYQCSAISLSPLSRIILYVSSFLVIIPLILTVYPMKFTNIPTFLSYHSYSLCLCSYMPIINLIYNNLFTIMSFLRQHFAAMCEKEGWTETIPTLIHVTPKELVPKQGN